MAVIGPAGTLHPGPPRRSLRSTEHASGIGRFVYRASAPQHHRIHRAGRTRPSNSHRPRATRALPGRPRWPFARGNSLGEVHANQNSGWSVALASKRSACGRGSPLRARRPTRVPADRRARTTAVAEPASESCGDGGHPIHRCRRSSARSPSSDHPWRQGGGPIRRPVSTGWGACARMRLSSYPTGIRKPLSRPVTHGRGGWPVERCSTSAITGLGG
jgi:hypothetical protein